MHALRRFFLCLGVVCLALYVQAEVDPIVIKGSHFFYQTNGTAFFVRGIVYSPIESSSTGSVIYPDPLASGPTCRRDIPYLSSLNINVILVGGTDSERDHSECMEAFSDAGIYIIAQVSLGGGGPVVGWDPESLKHHTNIIDSLANNTNLLGLFLAIDESNGPTDMLYFQAEIRDMKWYMIESGHRSIPIIFRAPPQLKDSIDFMWCHDHSPDVLAVWMSADGGICYTEEDLDPAPDISSSINAPQIWDNLYCFTENGTVDDRSYDFLTQAFSDQASESLNGAILWSYYAWYQSNYTDSLMQYDDTSDKINAVRPRPGYSAVSSVLATVKPSHVAEADYHPTTTLPPCPSGTEWGFSTALPPTPYEPLCSCMLNSLRCTAKLDAVEQLSNDAWSYAVRNICEKDMYTNCRGIASNTTSGKYGAFSTCNRTAIYSWAASQYWTRTGTCNLNGTAELRDAQPEPVGDCKFLLDQVGESGQSTLTAFLGTATTAGRPQGTGLTTEYTPDDSSGADLSTGAKAGIGVGVPMFVAACALSGLVLLQRKRRVDAMTQAESDVPEFVPPQSEVQQGQPGINDLPEVQTLLRT